HISPRILWLFVSGLLAVFVRVSSGGAVHLTRAFSKSAATAAPTQAGGPTPTFSAQQNAAALPQLHGDIIAIHDPSMIKAGGKYYIFSTGPGILIHCSDDMITWKSCQWIFPVNPFWIKAAVPGVGDLWAPDISFFAGKYHVYYAASTFGS